MHNVAPKFPDRIPAGRWGHWAILMGPVVFPASSAADYINGYTIAVDMFSLNNPLPQMRFCKHSLAEKSIKPCPRIVVFMIH